MEQLVTLGSRNVNKAVMAGEIMESEEEGGGTGITYIAEMTGYETRCWNGVLDNLSYFLPAKMTMIKLILTTSVPVLLVHPPLPITAAPTYIISITTNFKSDTNTTRLNTLPKSFTRLHLTSIFISETKINAHILTPTKNSFPLLFPCILNVPVFIALNIVTREIPVVYQAAPVQRCDPRHFSRFVPGNGS